MGAHGNAGVPLRSDRLSKTKRPRRRCVPAAPRPSPCRVDSPTVRDCSAERARPSAVKLVVLLMQRQRRINVAKQEDEEIVMRMRIVVPTIAVLLAVNCASADERPLRAGDDATFAPHAMPTLSGGVDRFIIDLGNGIAGRLRRKLEIDATQFSGLVPGLQAGTYDFLIAPVTVNKERAESLLFTEGYINTDFQFAVKRETPDIKDMADLKGKTIAVNKGSTYDLWARDNSAKYGWNVES